jgi:hypothetical protein
MGRSDLELGGGSDGDGEQDTVPKIPIDNGGSDAASGEVSADETPRSPALQN